VIKKPLKPNTVNKKQKDHGKPKKTNENRRKPKKTNENHGKQKKTKENQRKPGQTGENRRKPGKTQENQGKPRKTMPGTNWEMSVRLSEEKENEKKMSTKIFATEKTNCSTLRKCHFWNLEGFGP